MLKPIQAKSSAAEAINAWPRPETQMGDITQVLVFIQMNFSKSQTTPLGAKWLLPSSGRTQGTSRSRIPEESKGKFGPPMSVGNLRGSAWNWTLQEQDAVAPRSPTRLAKLGKLLFLPSWQPLYSWRSFGDGYAKFEPKLLDGVCYWQAQCSYIIYIHLSIYLSICLSIYRRYMRDLYVLFDSSLSGFQNFKV